MNGIPKWKTHTGCGYGKYSDVELYQPPDNPTVGNDQIIVTPIYQLTLIPKDGHVSVHRAYMGRPSYMSG